MRGHLRVCSSDQGDRIKFETAVLKGVGDAKVYFQSK